MSWKKFVTSKWYLIIRFKQKWYCLLIASSCHSEWGGMHVPDYFNSILTSSDVIIVPSKVCKVN